MSLKKRERMIIRQLSSSCSPRQGVVGAEETLERVVDAYLKEFRPDARRELRWYVSQPDLEAAIEVAALSKLPSGKRHPHQRRIPRGVLETARDRLLAADLQSSRTFDDLHETVRQEIGGIRGIGELFTYDVAHRIGAFLGLVPERIYLHAGTRVGARVLRLGAGRAYLDPAELPEAFRRLAPAEIEDCLCIYKDHMRRK